MRLMKKGWRIAALAAAGIMLLTGQASALLAPYEGYTYDYWGESVPSLAGHTVKEIYEAEAVGTDLTGCEDMFVYQDELYIISSTQKKILVLDQSYRLVRTIDSFRDMEGNPIELVTPTGIYIREDTLYVADQGGFILRGDMEGNVEHIYTKPDSFLLEDLTEYKPSKVTADAAGNCYVLCVGLFEGLVNYDKNGDFVGFYGANQVQLSASDLAASIWKQILSREAAQSMIRFVPVEYSNLYIVGDFIYTVTKANTNSTDEVRKLNAMGDNVLHYRVNDASYPMNNFGDVERATYMQTSYDSQLVDVHVDEDGVITALDFERGRLFQYDQECHIIAIFGGNGNQRGAFVNPVAVEKFGGNYVVMDKEKCSLTVFEQTEYMSQIRQGIRYYQNGSEELTEDEVLTLWEEVLDLNSGYRLAHLNIGRIYSSRGEYEKAMECFLQAQSRNDYSSAFRYWRTEYLKANLIWIIPVAVIVLALVVLLVRFCIRKLGFSTQKVKMIYH
ncbi:MAG: hypothetical protein IJY82_04260 [Oscillospiraceae bacterium]|nr:hypothetical protein [Oscillospiraceae bacterium]